MNQNALEILVQMATERNHLTREQVVSLWEKLNLSDSEQVNHMVVPMILKNLVFTVGITEFASFDELIQLYVMEFNWRFNCYTFDQIYFDLVYVFKYGKLTNENTLERTFHTLVDNKRLEDVTIKINLI